MTWRDDLHLEGKGSFRNEDFYVKTVQSTIGRRIVTHEYPGKDDPYSEDLGRAARRYTLEAYVLGDDYMVARDALRKAFEQPGPGPLTHPYWGHMTVTVAGPVRIRETTDEGGMARFTLDVVEADPEIKFFAAPDTEAEVEEAADEANEAIAEDLEDEWTVTDVIEAVRDAAQALIDGVNGVTSTINKIKGQVNAVMNQIDAVGDAITDLADTAASVILAPGQMVEAIEGVVGDLVSSISTIGDAWDSYFTDDETAGSMSGTPSTSPTGGTPASGPARAEALMSAFREGFAYGDGFADVDETTPQREAEATNQAAMIAYMRGIFTIETCRAAALLPFASYDQAVAIRDELADALDTLADTADDISYAALMDLRSAIMRHLTNASADLPRVITYTPATMLPALVIAQHLYGDSKRDIDIIDRNNIRNPCRVPGGAALEVLSDD